MDGSPLLTGHAPGEAGGRPKGLPRPGPPAPIPLLLSLASLLILGPSVPGPTGAQGAAEPLRIGVAGPLTGDQRGFGEEVRLGAGLALEEWNARGGPLGRRVEAVWGDDQHDTKQAVAVAGRFVSLGVAGVVGHFNSSTSVAAAPLYNEAKIVQVTPTATSPELTERGFWNVFRVAGRDDQQGRVAAQFAAVGLRKRRIAILHDRTPYGRGIAEEARRALERLGVRPLAFEGILQGEKDYGAVLAAVKAKGPDAIFFGGIHPEAIILTAQMREAGMEATFLAADGVWGREFAEIGGPAAEGAYVLGGPDPRRLKEAQPVLRRARDRAGRGAGEYALYSYVAASLLLEAIARAGTTEGPVVAAVLRARRWRTALGPIAFDEKGDRTVPPYVVWQVRAGRLVELGGEPQGQQRRKLR